MSSSKPKPKPRPDPVDHVIGILFPKPKPKWRLAAREVAEGRES